MRRFFALCPALALLAETPELCGLTDGRVTIAAGPEGRFAPGRKDRTPS